MNLASETDILIAGGGIVGLVAACLLADAGQRVCVVEPLPPCAAPVGPMGVRTYSISPASVRVLQALDVWIRLDPERIAPFTAMEVRDAGSSGCLRFDAADIGEPTLGFIVEHGHVQYFLERAARVRAGIRIVAGMVSGIERDQRRTIVRLTDGARLTATLVVAADGAGSRIRALSGVPVTSHDYRQTAIVCNVRTERPHEHVARQHFLGDGPLAFLPLPEPAACSVVWSTTPDMAERVLMAGEKSFCASLGGAFGDALGRIVAAGPRRSSRLHRLHAAAYVGRGCVLIGDAAHVVHPLAGQGLNLGIMDAAALAEVLAEHGRGRAITNAALRRYERWRRSENTAMLMLCDGLNRLFRESHPLLRRIRGAGLNATDRSAPLKRWLAGHAAGTIGDQPRVVRRPAMV